MDEELLSLLANDTWELKVPPAGVKPIPVKWVYKVKINPDGSIERYKARLVAKGFVQRDGVDYTELFAPTSRHTTFRVLCAKVVSESLLLHHTDIAFTIGALARYMAAPTKDHWDAAIGVGRYLKSTAHYRLHFVRGSSPLEGYCDADYASDVNTRRSTTGYAFILNGAAVSWSSRLQPTVAVSTTEAEYMAAAAATKEALWLRSLLTALGMTNRINGGVQIACDNQAALKIIANPSITPRSKHIDVLHHFVRERAALRQVQFHGIGTADMVADGLTKALALAKLSFCSKEFGLH